MQSCSYLLYQEQSLIPGLPGTLSELFQDLCFWATGLHAELPDEGCQHA